MKTIASRVPSLVFHSRGFAAGLFLVNVYGERQTLQQYIVNEDTEISWEGFNLNLSHPFEQALAVFQKFIMAKFVEAELTVDEVRYDRVIKIAFRTRETP